MTSAKVEANEELRRTQGALGVDATNEVLPFLCECEDPACRQVILLAAWEYAVARAEPGRRLVAAGHSAAGDVVARGNGYTVVQQEG